MPLPRFANDTTVSSAKVESTEDSRALEKEERRRRKAEHKEERERQERC